MSLSDLIQVFSLLQLGIHLIRVYYSARAETGILWDMLLQNDYWLDGGIYNYLRTRIYRA